MRFSKQSIERTAVGHSGFALAIIIALVCRASLVSASAITAPAGEASMKNEVPQPILESITKEVAAVAKVGREQLVIVRAESVVWNDGSLGCPEPGMMYTQMLVNGYWIVIEAAGKQYDFRVGRGGSFRLCPPGKAMRRHSSAQTNFRARGFGGIKGLPSTFAMDSSKSSSNRRRLAPAQQLGEGVYTNCLTL